MQDDWSTTVPMKAFTNPKNSPTEVAQSPARWSTRPPATQQGLERPRPQLKLPPWRTITPPLVGMLIICILWFQIPDSFSTNAKLTLAVFGAAIWFWIFTKIHSAYIALSAATTLTVLGIIKVPQLFQTLSDETIWLLIGAFIIASAVSASGLAERAAMTVTRGVTSPRVLVHLITLTIVCTVYAVPLTSIRAALLMPVFLGLAHSLGDRDSWLTQTLSLIFPIAILFSAIGSLIGAGAHIITNQIIQTNGLEAFSFTEWLLFGLPLALVSSHIAAEITFLATSSAQQRKSEISIQVDECTEHSRALTSWEIRTLLVLIVSVVLWSTENLHGVHPALVALIGGLLTTCPCFGAVTFSDALKNIPWSLLLLMAGVLAMNQALTVSGAADEFAKGLFGSATNNVVSGTGFVFVVIILSTASHMLVQSRAVRAAILIPIVVLLAPSFGVNPLAIAFIAAAASGFSHTFATSAQSLHTFQTVPKETNIPTFDNDQLLRVAALLAPVHIVLCIIFAFGFWPLLGLSVFS